MDPNTDSQAGHPALLREGKINTKLDQETHKTKLTKENTAMREVAMQDGGRHRYKCGQMGKATQEGTQLKVIQTNLTMTHTRQETTKVKQEALRRRLTHTRCCFCVERIFRETRWIREIMGGDNESDIDTVNEAERQRVRRDMGTKKGTNSRGHTETHRDTRGTKEEC